MVVFAFFVLDLFLLQVLSKKLIWHLAAVYSQGLEASGFSCFILKEIMFLVIITKETRVLQQQIFDKILIFAKIYEAGKNKNLLTGL